jgi:hypothetical protein
MSGLLKQLPSLGDEARYLGIGAAVAQHLAAGDAAVFVRPTALAIASATFSRLTGSRGSRNAVSSSVIARSTNPAAMKRSGSGVAVIARS